MAEVTKERDSLKESLTKLEHTHNTEHADGEATKTVLSEVRAMLRAETDKNLELGAELLTLLNQKELISRRADDTESKLLAANAKIVVYYFMLLCYYNVIITLF